MGATVDSIGTDGTIRYGTPVRTVVRTCGNRKVGAHTVTTSRERTSCPRDCDMWRECYGQNTTQSGGSLFDNVTAAPTDGPVLAAAVGRRSARAVRFNVVGDYLRDDGTAVDREYIDATNDAADQARERGIPAWSYTHAWSAHPDRESVRPEDFRYTVRASCATIDRARDAIAAGWAPTVVVDSPSDPIIGTVVDGRRVVLCPAQRHARVTCESCGLCATTAGIVAFAAHGAASARARRR